MIRNSIQLTFKRVHLETDRTSASLPLTKDSAMIRFAAASFAFFMLAAPALAVEFEPNDQGFTEFNMPSGNIGCFYVPAGGTDVYKTSDGGAELSCDRVGQPMRA